LIDLTMLTSTHQGRNLLSFCVETIVIAE